MQSSRKSLGKLFGVCGSPASLSRNFLAFAGVPQASRKTFWRLRDSRKRLGKCRGTCAACANVSAWGKRSFRCRGVTLTPHRRPAGPEYVSFVFKLWWLYMYGLYMVDLMRTTVSSITNNAMAQKRREEEEIEVIYKEKLFIMWRKCKDLMTISLYW